MTIFNKYKDILNDLIDSSDPKFLDWLKLIDKKSRNALRSRSGLRDLLKKNCLDKNVLDLNKLLWLAFKTEYF